jgi:recombination protein RecR
VASLPGIGRKTALRLVLHLLRQPNKDVEAFTGAISKLKEEVQYCRVCHTISDQEVCPICQSHSRDKHTVCVVENVQDVMSIENTGQYNGLYHVLGGIISPMDGVGPSDIEIDSLIKRVEHDDIHEVILALPTTMEGDTTNFYIYRRLQNLTKGDNASSSNSLIASKSPKLREESLLEMNLNIPMRSPLGAPSLTALNSNFETSALARETLKHFN